MNSFFSYTTLHDKALYDSMSTMLAAKSANIDTKKLEGRRIKLDEDHPATLETKNDLALLYIRQSDFDKAERLLLEAVQGRRPKLGHAHPYSKESIKTPIGLYEAWNKPEKVKKWQTKLTQIEDFEE